MADMKKLLRSNDEWLRHRIRAIYLETMEENKDEVSETQRTWNGKKLYSMACKYAARHLEL